MPRSFRVCRSEPIIVLCAEASFRAIRNGTQLAEEGIAIAETWRGNVKVLADYAVWPVLELLESRPVVNAAVLESELGLDYMCMKRAVDFLAEASIVIGIDKYKHGRFWPGPPRYSPPSTPSPNEQAADRYPRPPDPPLADVEQEPIVMKPQPGQDRPVFRGGAAMPS